MTAREFANALAQELRSCGHKEVRVRDITPCEIAFHNGFRSVSTMLFDPTRVPDDAEVTPTFIASEEMQRGAMIAIRHIPPRCRKEQSKYYYAALV